MTRRVSHEVLSGFYSEVLGYLPRIRGSIESFTRQPSRPEELREAYRLLHSIKGTAALVDLVELSRIADRGEMLLDEIMTGRQPFDAEAESRLLVTAERLNDSLNDSLATVSDESPATVATASSGPVEAPVTGRPYPAPAEASATEGEPLDAELLGTVREEFRGYLESIGTQLQAFDGDRTRNDRLAAIRRPLHTLKGTAGIVGLVEVSHLAHRMEDLLAELDRKARAVSDQDLQLLLQATDLLHDLADSGRPTPVLAARIKALDRAFEAATPRPSTPATEPVEKPTGEIALGVEPLTGDEPQGLAVTAPAPAALPDASILRVRADRLDGVFQLLGDITLQRAGFDRQVSHMNELRGELQLNLRRLGRVARQLTTELDSGGLGLGGMPSSNPGEAAAEAEFDSLEMDRYTQLSVLSRQLEEAATDSATVGSELENLVREVEGFQSRLGGLTRDVRERLAQLRTVRFGTLSPRLHRTVRVTAGKRERRVALELEGEGVELDKNVLEQVAEPLLHLLRNAVDHGIEPPDLRRAANKPEEGRITVGVTYQGTEALIRIADDGAGLDTERLREQAVRLELLPPEEAAAAAPRDLHQLVFEHGLSTARELSEVSGRGIGLEAAAATVRRLGGNLEVESAPGQGTTFTIRLPGSQSILRVLLVETGGESLAIPLPTIHRVESVPRADLTDVEGQRQAQVLGESLRAIELGEALGLPPRRVDGSASIPTIIVELSDQRLALLSERILGVQEVVARPLSELFSQRLHGFGNAALTGEGRVVLVVNPTDLLRSGPIPEAVSPVLRRPKQPEILIVDDSLSVRKVLRRLMERQGWRCWTARDGEEALDLLPHARTPDLAIVDLEMPRMDGYELTRALRLRRATREMPLLILTTRAGEKHRRKAFALGATHYMVKPFQERALLEIIRQSIALDSRPTQ
ncbi:MAG: response regulator [Acidobacteriota bacterium]